MKQFFSRKKSLKEILNAKSVKRIDRKSAMEFTKKHNLLIVNNDINSGEVLACGELEVSKIFEELGEDLGEKF